MIFVAGNLLLAMVTLLLCTFVLYRNRIHTFCIIILYNCILKGKILLSSMSQRNLFHIGTWEDLIKEPLFHQSFLPLLLLAILAGRDIQTQMILSPQRAGSYALKISGFWKMFSAEGTEEDMQSGWLLNGCQVGYHAYW